MHLALSCLLSFSGTDCLFSVLPVCVLAAIKDQISAIGVPSNLGFVFAMPIQKGLLCVVCCVKGLRTFWVGLGVARRYLFSLFLMVEIGLCSSIPE